MRKVKERNPIIKRKTMKNKKEIPYNEIRAKQKENLRMCCDTYTKLNFQSQPNLYSSLPSIL